MKRGQTATEYLIILALIMVIAIIVVSALGYMPSFGGRSGDQANMAKLQLLEVGVQSYSVTPNGTTVQLRNNKEFMIRIVNVSINTTSCVPNPLNAIPTILDIGSSRTIFCPNINESVIGSRYEYPLEIIWERVDPNARYVLFVDSAMVGVVGESTRGPPSSGDGDEGSGSTQFTVTYDGNGNTAGSVPIDSINYVSGDSVTVLDDEGNLARVGFVFSGWNTAANGLGTNYQPGASFPITSNITLYANWQSAFYELGGTIYCHNAEVGETGEVNGVTYTAHSSDSLYGNRTNATALEQACTSLVTSFNPSNSWAGGLFYMSNLQPNISHWDTSNVKNMYRMFVGSQFNDDISGWNTSNVQNMERMFYFSQFTGDISGWDTSNVQNMNGMFESSQFNGDISDWNVSNVQNMVWMFSNAKNFNQDLSGWCVSQIGSAPGDFDNGANSWTLPRPQWGQPCS